MRNVWFPLLIVLCTVAVGVYFVVRPTLHHEITPSVLRVGVLPDEGVEALRKRYVPLVKYLSEKIGLDFQLVLPSDYNELVRMFGNREVELAYFGGLTFVQALDSYDAAPLVMRDVDTRFTSWFLVKGSKAAAHGFSDFKGKRFTFGNRLSTSGHLMPRHFMYSEKQIIPEVFFSEVHYSRGHDETAYLVRDGAIDLGVANSEIIRGMIRDGRLKENDLRVLWETPPYTDYVWTVHDDLRESVKTQLRDAFLELNPENTVHNEILASMGAESYLPAGVSDFLLLKQVADTLGMLNPETQ